MYGCFKGPRATVQRRTDVSPHEAGNGGTVVLKSKMQCIHKQQQMADQLTEIVTDAVITIAKPDEPVDLHMIEIMHVSMCKVHEICMLIGIEDGTPKPK